MYPMIVFRQRNALYCEPAFTPTYGCREGHSEYGCTSRIPYPAFYKTGFRIGGRYVHPNLRIL